jgi:hypothetical protein
MDKFQAVGSCGVRGNYGDDEEVFRPVSSYYSSMRRKMVTMRSAFSERISSLFGLAGSMKCGSFLRKSHVG